MHPKQSIIFLFRDSNAIKAALRSGIPEVLSDYYTTKDLTRVQAMQSSIIETYEKDFGHYRNVANPIYLQLCFRQSPLFICNAYKQRPQREYHLTQPLMRKNSN